MSLLSPGSTTKEYSRQALSLVPRHIRKAPDPGSYPLSRIDTNYQHAPNSKMHISVHMPIYFEVLLAQQHLTHTQGRENWKGRGNIGNSSSVRLKMHFKYVNLSRGRITDPSQVNLIAFTRYTDEHHVNKHEIGQTKKLGPFHYPLLRFQKCDVEWHSDRTSQHEHFWLIVVARQRHSTSHHNPNTTYSRIYLSHKVMGNNPWKVYLSNHKQLGMTTSFKTSSS